MASFDILEIEGAMARLGIQKVIHNQRMEPLTPKRKAMIAGMVLSEMANKIIRSAEKKREEDNNGDRIYGHKVS